MPNRIYMNLNTYATISERLYPGASVDPDYALFQEENTSYVLIQQFQFPNCPQKYWKRTMSSPPFREMTPEEKSVVDQAEADARQAYLNGFKNLDNMNSIENYNKLIKASFLVCLDEVNKLRTKTNMTPPTYTVQQFKDAITAKYNGL